MFRVNKGRAERKAKNEKTEEIMNKTGRKMIPARSLIQVEPE